MELNNVFVYLVSEFFKENLFSLISILVLSGSITLLYTNGISKYTANIFDKVNDNKINEVWSLFIRYIIFSIPNSISFFLWISDRFNSKDKALGKI